MKSIKKLTLLLLLVACSEKEDFKQRMTQCENFEFRLWIAALYEARTLEEVRKSIETVDITKICRQRLEILDAVRGE